MSATSLDLSQIKTDALSAASTFRTLIGLGTGNTPTFLGASLTGGTVTASTPLINATQTWNSAATVFTGILANVTDTASNASSLLMDLQVGGSSVFRVGKNGRVNFLSNAGLGSAPTIAIGTSGFYGEANNSIFITVGGTYRGKLGATGFALGSSNSLQWENSTPDSSSDLFLLRDAADTLAQRRSTNAQTFRIYNTFSDASNYERGKLEWSSNVFRIGTEKAGTGSARALELQTDGTTRLTIDTSGKMLVNVASSFAHTHIKANSGAASLALEPATNNVSGVYFGGNSGDFSNSILRLGNSFDMQVTAGGALTFRTGSPVTERLSISATGLFTIADALNIAVGTTTGTKIGTATTQKLGFFNATPVVQPTAVADATDAASVITQLNALLSRMRTLGLIAT